MTVTSIGAVGRPFTRRGALALGAAATLAPGLARAQDTGAEMVRRASVFLANLDGPALAEASRPFNDSLRRQWDYMTGSRVSPGLPLESMAPEQEDLALDLVAAGLSSAGFAKAERVMLLQDVLRDELNKGAPDRNSKRFSLLIFGTPGEGAWGWRFEGHHLTLNYTLNGAEVVSVTPSSFSSDPNAVPSGPHQGMVALAEEETLGRQLFGDLESGARGAALLRAESLGNVQSVAGRDDLLRGAEGGLPVADMTVGQADLVQRMIEVYALDHLPATLAGAQTARLAAEDMAAIRFGWAGDPDRGSIYYRLVGRTFAIEFATLRNQPQHHHTIRHDFDWNLGAHAVG